MSKTVKKAKTFQNTVIPSDWEVKTFDECFKHLKTYTFSRNQLNYENDENIIYNIHYGDIHSTFPRNILDVGKNINIIPRIINPELNEPELLRDGDLIMADVSEDYEGIGQSVEIINIGDKKIVAGTHTFPLRPKSKFAPKYAGYIFSSFYVHKELKKIATGISVFGLSKSNIAKIQLPIPPLPEQKAIAQVLSTWDHAIQKTEALLAQKELRKKWLMQQLLTGKKRLKGFDGEWREGRIGDITQKISRRNKQLSDASIYSVTNNSGFVLQSNHFAGRVAGDDLSNYKIIKRQEFAYNPARINVGSLAYFEEDLGIISSLYVCFKTKSEILDYFLLQFLRLEHTKHRIISLGEGGVRIYLWYDLFSKIKIKFPSLKEQAAIAQVLQAADKEIELIKAKATQLREQKKGLMQQLLTGKKRLL